MTSHWDTYLDFVTERHRIWERRQLGLPQPWTADPILAKDKFTNIFRVLDPGSQFIFKLEDDDPLETLMRLFLYRHTGRVTAWQWLHDEMLGWPEVEDLPEIPAIWKPYREDGGSVFTSAYLVYPQSATRGTDKLESICDLTLRMATNGSFGDFLMADTQRERFACLRRNKGVADFMSMQILTDWGYTSHAGEDRENQFVIPGPGAVRGARLLEPKMDPLKTIQRAWVAMQLGSDCPLLGTRTPSLMDVQNTLCEYSKYARTVSRGGTKKVVPYVPAHPGPQEEPTLPAHWL